MRGGRYQPPLTDEEMLSACVDDEEGDCPVCGQRVEKVVTVFCNPSGLG